MIVIFVKNDTSYVNEDIIFLGRYNDMESCKQVIIKDVNEYIKINDFSECDVENEESYYAVFDENTKEKTKFFVHNFVIKTTVEIKEIK